MQLESFPKIFLRSNISSQVSFDGSHGYSFIQLLVIVIIFEKNEWWKESTPTFEKVSKCFEQVVVKLKIFETPGEYIICFFYIFCGFISSCICSPVLDSWFGRIITRNINQHCWVLRDIPSKFYQYCTSIIFV